MALLLPLVLALVVGAIVNIGFHAGWALDTVALVGAAPGVIVGFGFGLVSACSHRGRL